MWRLRKSLPPWPLFLGSGRCVDGKMEERPAEGVEESYF